MTLPRSPSDLESVYNVFVSVLVFVGGGVTVNVFVNVDVNATPAKRILALAGVEAVRSAQFLRTGLR